MSTVSKVFVIVNVVMAILFAGFQVTLYAKRVKFKDRWKNEVASKATMEKKKNVEIADLTQTKNTLTRDNDQLISTVKELKSTNQTLRANYREYLTKELESSARAELAQTKLNEADAELDRRHTQIDTMHKIILKQQQALTVAKRNEFNAKNQKIEFENELNNVRQQIHEVSREKARVERDLSHHNWIIEKLLEAGVDVNDLVFGPAATPAPAIKGLVLAVRRDVNLVMLSVGKDDGVKQGYKFTVYRRDRYIGKIEIEKVFHDMSSGRIIPALTQDEIIEGDSAATRIYGGSDF